MKRIKENKEKCRHPLQENLILSKNQIHFSCSNLFNQYQVHHVVHYNLNNRIVHFNLLLSHSHKNKIHFQNYSDHNNKYGNFMKIIVVKLMYLINSLTLVLAKSQWLRKIVFKSN